MKHVSLSVLATLALSGAVMVGCSENGAGVNPESTSAATQSVNGPGALRASSRRGGEVQDESSEELRRYRVTIMNLSETQPLSPPVVATHAKGFTMFEVGKLASRGLEAIAENGDESLMANRYRNSPMATDVVDVAMPLTRHGTMVGDFRSSYSFEIEAREHDRLSLAAMLICSNDGFTGLNSVKLPKKGRRMYHLRAYDAGTEDNTEMSADIVDGCSALGAVALSGDPNGNENDAVDTTPHDVIRPHRGILGVGDLDASSHAIDNKVGKVIIELLSDDDDHDDDHDND